MVGLGCLFVSWAIRQAARDVVNALLYPSQMREHDKTMGEWPYDDTQDKDKV